MDDQVGIVGGLQGKASVTDPATMAFLLVLLHDVLQVLPAFGKRQLETKRGGKVPEVTENPSPCLLLCEGSEAREIPPMQEAGLFYPALLTQFQLGGKKGD